ncbi:unnamed protein product, partial [Coccothraustes coccothraustes]
PAPGPAERSRASDRPPARLGRAGTARRAETPSGASPHRAARKAPDVLEEAATRRGGRGPDTEAPLAAGAARSAAGGGTAKERADRALFPRPRPSARRFLSPFSLSRRTTRLFFLSRLPPHRRPALLAAGTHGRSPDRGRHRHLARLERTPEGSRSHAAVTQLGTPGQRRAFPLGTARGACGRAAAGPSPSTAAAAAAAGRRRRRRRPPPPPAAAAAAAGRRRRRPPPPPPPAAAAAAAAAAA